MNCPQCGTYTEVLETRANAQGKRRRYQCANMHRFTTLEKRISPVQPAVQWEKVVEIKAGDLHR